MFDPAMARKAQSALSNYSVARRDRADYAATVRTVCPALVKADGSIPSQSECRELANALFPATVHDGRCSRNTMCVDRVFTVEDLAAVPRCMSALVTLGIPTPEWVFINGLCIRAATVRADAEFLAALETHAVRGICTVHGTDPCPTVQVGTIDAGEVPSADGWGTRRNTAPVYRCPHGFRVD